MARNYEVRSQRPVNEIITAALQGQSDIDGASLKTKRVVSFVKHGTHCVRCGLKGESFRIERVKDTYDQFAGWHLNLYAANGMMLTRDHIIPVSRGGEDVMSNFQTLCRVCNMIKGSRLPGEIQIIKHREASRRRRKEIDWAKTFNFQWQFRALRRMLLTRTLPALPRKRIK